MGTPESKYEFCFVNHRTGKQLRAEFNAPVLVPRLNPHLKQECSIWIVRYAVWHNDKSESREAVGATWLPALLLAVEYLTRSIPQDEEEDWETAEGISSWVALPSLLPLSWGYDVFREARSAVKEIDRSASERASLKRPDK